MSTAYRRKPMLGRNVIYRQARDGTVECYLNVRIQTSSYNAARLHIVLRIY